MKVKENLIEAFDLPQLWYECIERILTNGYEYVVQRGSFAGKRRKELDFALLHVKNPGNRPIIPEVPKDLLGLVPPPTDMEYVHSYLLGYLYTSEKKEQESYTYGSRLVGEVDQIRSVIEMLKNTPETNHATMEIGKPSDVSMEDPPCLRLVDVRVRYDMLHFIIYFRSWDAWAGLPTNLAALQLLKEYMAEQIGVKDGEMIAASKGLHLYDYQFEFAEYLTGRKKPP